MLGVALGVVCSLLAGFVVALEQELLRPRGDLGRLDLGDAQFERRDGVDPLLDLALPERLDTSRSSTAASAYVRVISR